MKKIWHTRVSEATQDVTCISPTARLCAAGYVKILEANTELQIAECGNTVSDECEAIVIKLFGLKYLINGRVRYFFYPKGAVKH